MCYKTFLWRMQDVLTFRRKRELKLSQRRVLIDSIKIGLASPIQIQKWAERELPNGKKTGKVANPKTVDYKTLKPVKDGLFCERIFGPVKDFVCACGKRQAGSKSKFCNECEVEWASCRTRRYRLGYIDLASPVTHVWYIKGRPNYIATLLGEKHRTIEAVTYCTKFILGDITIGGVGRPPKVSKTGGGGRTNLPAAETLDHRITSNASLRHVNDTSRAFDSLSLNSLSNVLHFRTLTPTLLTALAMQTPLRSSVFTKNGKGVANEPSKPSSSIERRRNSSLGFTFGLELPIIALDLPANKYRKKFSKKLYISKTIGTGPFSSQKLPQFQSISGKQLPKRLSGTFMEDKWGIYAHTLSKRSRKLRDTVYPNQSKSFNILGSEFDGHPRPSRGLLSRNFLNGAGGLLGSGRDPYPQGFRPATEGPLSTENSSGASISTQQASLALMEKDFSSNIVGVTRNPTASAFSDSIHQKASEINQTRNTFGLLPEIYSKKQTMPLSFAFAREPDERFQLLEFLHSTAEEGDLAIPIYNKSVTAPLHWSSEEDTAHSSREKDFTGVSLATSSLHFVNKMDKAFALQAMQWGGQRNPFPFFTKMDERGGNDSPEIRNLARFSCASQSQKPYQAWINALGLTHQIWDKTLFNRSTNRPFVETENNLIGRSPSLHFVNKMDKAGGFIATPGDQNPLGVKGSLQDPKRLKPLPTLLRLEPQKMESLPLLCLNDLEETANSLSNKNTTFPLPEKKAIFPTDHKAITQNSCRINLFRDPRLFLFYTNSETSHLDSLTFRREALERFLSLPTTQTSQGNPRFSKSVAGITDGVGGAFSIASNATTQEASASRAFSIARNAKTPKANPLLSKSEGVSQKNNEKIRNVVFSLYPFVHPFLQKTEKGWPSNPLLSLGQLSQYEGILRNIRQLSASIRNRRRVPFSSTLESVKPKNESSDKWGAQGANSLTKSREFSLTAPMPVSDTYESSKPHGGNGPFQDQSVDEAKWRNISSIGSGFDGHSVALPAMQRPYPFSLENVKRVPLQEMQSSQKYSTGAETLAENRAEKPILRPSTALPTAKLADLSRVNEIRQKLSYTGGEALKSLLNEYHMPSLIRYLEHEIREMEPEINDLADLIFPRRSQYTRLGKLRRWRAKQVRRLKIAKLFFQSNKRPEWMTLSKLPVLPPELRPIVRLDGGVVVVADLNKLYQKVIFRNNRLEALRMIDLSSVGQAKRLLQEAVDGLLDNGKGGAVPLSGPNDRPLKSLSDGLKGKRGRFRQNLLGKRVDYSGRSVIVVGPELELHQCGLPREMAIELFQPFVSQQLKERGVAENINGAKRFMKQSHPIIWEILQQLMQQHPVLLNRAPTLHRLGIQAFQPKLIQGRAILLHPLVCTAFNADFDGDQMAVHLPLSFQSQGEAWKLLWSRNNLLSPATGQPILVPSQDMVLGCYYLTTLNHRAGNVSIVNNHLTPQVTPLYRKVMEASQMVLEASEMTLEGPRSQIGPLAMQESEKDASLPLAKDDSLPSAKDDSLPSAKDDYLPSAKETEVMGQSVETGSTKIRDSLEKQNRSERHTTGLLVSNAKKIPSKSSLLERNDRRDFYSNSVSEAVGLYHQGNLSLHKPIWIKYNETFETGNPIEEPLEIRLQVTGRNKTIFCGQQFDTARCNDSWTDVFPSLFDKRESPLNDQFKNSYVVNQYIRTTAGKALVNNCLNLSYLE